MGTMAECRACKRKDPYLFLPMGLHPPANAFKRCENLVESDARFPLDAHACLGCGLIEVPDHVPPDFFRHYLYIPSAASTMHAHFEGLARTLQRRLLGGGGLLVDIGSNDGLLLSFAKALGLRTLGIEPAANLTAIAREKGLEVVNEYFNPETARAVRAENGPATVIVTTNTFNHIDDLHGFMEGVRTLLDDRGSFVVEVPHSLDLVEKNEFDTIYHEHLSEFSVRSFVDLYAFFDMEVHDIERLKIHGGSMRVYGQKKAAGRSASAVVAEWLAREDQARLFSESTYVAFAERVGRIRRGLMDMLGDLKRQGKKLAGYGAPAKGSTLLNYYGIGPDLLDFLADKNPLKQGLCSPGSRIPIVPPERVLETQPDYLLILAWNFADEIMEEQAEYRRRGGKFILPIPEPRVIG